MAIRTNAHDLAPGLFQIIETVTAAKRSVRRLELIHQYSGPSVNRLIESGYLAVQLGSGCLKITPLTKIELNGWPPADERSLSREWQSSKPISEIAEGFGRTGGEVIMRARRLGLVRPRKQSDRFGSYVPTWRKRALRVELVDAERRGLDLRDDGDRLEHRALQKRFRNACTLISVPIEGWSPCWSAVDLSAFRGFRNDNRSIAMMAHILCRPLEQVAHRLVFEGMGLGVSWSRGEEMILAMGVRDCLSDAAIAAQLPGRTIRAVKYHVNKILPRPRPGAPWATAEERRLLDAVAGGCRGNDLATKIPGRSNHAVRRHLYALMHRTLENEPLSVIELKILFRATRCGMLAADVAKLLPRPVWQIEELMTNIDRRTYTHGREPSLTPEQAEEAAKLWDDPDIPMHTIARKFGVSRATVYRTLKRRRDGIDSRA